jgi:hypothetical protein
MAIFIVDNPEYEHFLPWWLFEHNLCVLINAYQKAESIDTPNEAMWATQMSMLHDGETEL